MSNVDPYCKLYPGAFIEFNGLITPCCWLVTDKNRYDALEEFMGEDFSKIFITNSQEEIVKAYNKLEQSWDSDTPFKTCVKVCRANDSNSALSRKTKE